MDQAVTIIGAGHAAGELATALRQNGHAGPIRLIGDEAWLPYQRPPLSKAYLTGKVQVESLLLKPEQTYAQAKVQTRLGVRVVAVDRGASCLTLDDGSTEGYETLVFATGGRPRPLAAEGADQAGRCTNFHYLRTIEDVRRIQAQFLPGKRLAVIGGGYIGLEVAAAARGRGIEVTVLEAMPRVLARVTAPAMSAFYERVHREAGVDIRTGAAVRAFRFGDAGDTVSALDLEDGTTLEADMFIAGIGLVPNTELAAAAGLPVDNGVLVDASCRTEDDAIFAIGDCASQPNAYAGRRIRLESVPSALEQARTVALILTGKPPAAGAVPWFWSDQYDLKLQMVGLSPGYDEMVLRGSFDSRSFIAFYLREDRLIAADAVSRPADFMVAKQLVARGARVKPARLCDETTPLKTLLT